MEFYLGDGKGFFSPNYYIFHLQNQQKTGVPKILLKNMIHCIDEPVSSIYSHQKVQSKGM